MRGGPHVPDGDREGGGAGEGCERLSHSHTGKQRVSEKTLRVSSRDLCQLYGGWSERSVGLPGCWLKSNSLTQVPERLCVLADDRSRIGAAVGPRVEPLPAEEVVLDELQVRVEGERLVVDVARAAPTG